MRENSMPGAYQLDRILGVSVGGHPEIAGAQRELSDEERRYFRTEAELEQFVEAVYTPSMRSSIQSWPSE